MSSSFPIDSSNVVCYYLEQHVLKDGKWVLCLDSVPYVLRDDSAAIQTRDYQLANAFSHGEKGNSTTASDANGRRTSYRDRDGQLMADGRRYFDGKITQNSSTKHLATSGQHLRVYLSTLTFFLRYHYLG